MPPGSRLVLISDGVTESENCNGIEFGATELQRDLGAADPIQAIFTSLHRFCEGTAPLDDRTMLVIDRTT